MLGCNHAALMGERDEQNTDPSCGIATMVLVDLILQGFTVNLESSILHIYCSNFPCTCDLIFVLSHGQDFPCPGPAHWRGSSSRSRRVVQRISKSKRQPGTLRLLGLSFIFDGQTNWRLCFHILQGFLGLNHLKNLRIFLVPDGVYGARSTSDLVVVVCIGRPPRN